MAVSESSQSGVLILGVDGGGTKTVACLARISSDGAEKILGRGRAGSSNVKAVGLAQAQENLRHAIDVAWQDAQLAPTAVDVAVLGLSGAGHIDTQTAVSEWVVGQGISRKAKVVHDALPVLAAGTDDDVGVALIAGTGAVAFAMDSQKNSTVVGGWGYWFGDEGSAFWLGQAAVRAVAKASDGRGDATLLIQALLDRLEIADARSILTELGRKSDVRSSLAELADIVTRCGEQGDGVARHIVQEAGRELCLLVASAVGKLSLADGYSLALAGGVLCGSETVREALFSELGNRNISPRSIEIVREPVLGCLRLAQRELHET